MSVKKYVVELSDEERAVCREVVKKLKGTSQKVKRANILLKSDEGWTDEKIADAFNCRRQTVENVRRRLVECGFEQTLNGKKRANPPVPKLLDGEQEARIIAMRLGEPPKGFGNQIIAATRWHPKRVDYEYRRAGVALNSTTHPNTAVG
ncbi:MAG: helix-turn-helix domain-containing protein [Planctomycetota bacterium]|nr:MAG: helix-turn-helix domain-containing protein [Planctomycetota bacterium]REK21403.1 MAG: helix-turn-helix domain-containing protein [Planctomycetota bacterium]REK40086.1 MAG: helix-turn-helix domain-containing protein [Planctomycetota bacterium]